MTTWKELLPVIDAAIASLARLMNSDPLHGVAYQQSMAVMLFRRQYVLIKMAESEVTI